MMNTIDLTDFRRRSYARAMQRVLAECANLDVLDLWQTDLTSSQRVRSAALAGRTERLATALDQAAHLGSKAGFGEAVALLQERRQELRQLEHEAAKLTPTVAVVVLQSGWGMPGRSKKIIAWIIANKATFQQVAAEFQLAASTSKKYVQSAKRQGRNRP